MYTVWEWTHTPGTRPARFPLGDLAEMNGRTGELASSRARDPGAGPCSRANMPPEKLEASSSLAGATCRHPAAGWGPNVTALMRWLDGFKVGGHGPEVLFSALCHRIFPRPIVETSPRSGASWPALNVEIQEPGAKQKRFLLSMQHACWSGPSGLV